MPTYRLMIIFILLGAWVIAKGISGQRCDLLWLLVPILLIITALWVLKPQVDYWWHQKFPPDIDPIGKKIIEQYPFYQVLSDEDKTKFRQRVAVFVLNKEFIGMKIETIPDDLKVMVAANVVLLTLDQEDFLLEPFNQIAFYNHPFPSPQYPKQMHISELETTDGTLIFSVPHLIVSQSPNGQHFNIVMYEWAKALIHKYPEKTISKNRDWNEIESDSGWAKSFIEKSTGLTGVDKKAVSLMIDVYDGNSS